MFSALGLYYRARSAKKRIVTTVEFMRAARGAGWSDDKTKTQINIAKILGSSIMVGAEILTIKDKS
jgi:hypothetical protein